MKSNERLVGITKDRKVNSCLRHLVADVAVVSPNRAFL